MVQELETLRARAEFDSRDFDRGAREVVNRLRDMDRQAEGFSRTFDRSVGGFGRSIGDVRAQIGAFSAGLFNMRNAIGALGGALVARQVTDYADAWTLAQDRVRLAVRPHEDLTERMETLFDVAQSARVGFGNLFDVYGRVERSTRSLGLSTSQLTSITEGLAQTIRVSGANAQEGAAALIQFGQGLASGRLQGEELRSIMEQLPTLFDALLQGIQQVAPELNVTRANFRELAAEGLITSELLVRAFTTQLPRIQQEFDKTTVTIQDGITRVNNAVAKLVGTQSDATGAASGIAEAMSDLATVLESEGFRGGFEDAVQGIRSFIGAAGDVIAVMKAMESQIRSFPGLGEVFGFDIPEPAGRLESAAKFLEVISDIQEAADGLRAQLKFKLGIELDEGELRGVMAGLDREIAAQQQRLGQVGAGEGGSAAAQTIEAAIRDLKEQREVLDQALQERVAEAAVPEAAEKMRQELEAINAQIVENQQQLGALREDGVGAVERDAVATLEAKIAELKEQAARMEAAARDIAGGLDVTPATAPAGGTPEEGGVEATRAAFAQRFAEIDTEVAAMQANLDNALSEMGEDVDEAVVNRIRGEIAKLREERDALTTGLNEALGRATDVDPATQQARADLEQLNALIQQSVEERNALLADTTKEVDASAKAALDSTIEELTSIRDAIREGLEGAPVPVPQARPPIPPSVARAGRAETLVADKEAELLFQARIEGLGEVEREVEEFKRTLEQSDVDVGDVDLGPIRAAAAELASVRKEAEPAPIDDYIAGLREELELTQASVAERARMQALIGLENAAEAEGRQIQADGFRTTNQERQEALRLAQQTAEAMSAAQFEGLLAGLDEEIRLTGAVASERGAIRALIEAENAAKEAGRSLTLGELALLEEKLARLDLVRVQQQAAAEEARKNQQIAEDAPERQRELTTAATGGSVGDFGGALFGDQLSAELDALDAQGAAWENMTQRIDRSLAQAGAEILTFQVGLDDLDDFVLSTLQSIAQSFVQAGLQQAIMGFTNLLLGGFTGAPTGTMVPGPTIPVGGGFTFQEGGPFKGGQVLRVGEIRPETVVTFPGGGGMVIPYASGGAFGEAKRGVGDQLIADEAMRAVMPFASGGMFGGAKRGGADRLWTGADEEVLEAVAPFAAGGRFTGGQTLRVGESGPETIFTLPGGGGFVVPYATTVLPFAGGGAFGGVTMPPEMLKPAEVVLPPDVAREIALATGEAIKQRDDDRGGRGVVVNVNDQRGGGGPPVEVSQRRGPDGQQTIDVTVLDSLSRMGRTGDLDPVFSKYGGRRIPDA